MDVVEQSIVKGGEGNEEIIPLSPLDVMTGHFSVRGVYVFDRTPDIDRMKQSLSEALALFPEFGASMMRDNHQFFLKLDDRGAGFSVYRYPQAWKDCQHLLPVTETSPLIDTQLMPQDVFAGEEPLSAFRVTLFDDGYWTLSVRNIHSQADGSAYCDFLQSWSALYCGKKARKPVGFSRTVIDSLARGHGYTPSYKFRVLPALNFDLAERVFQKKEQQGYAQVSLPQMALNALQARCSSQAGTRLSTSDLLHALGWKAFALSSPKNNDAFCTLYSIFDIRHVKGLALPRHYRGNAVLERHASLRFGELRTWRLDEIALFFRTQTKPLKLSEVEADIAFLKREYECGNIDQDYGRFSNFIRGSVVECLDGTGVFVNDMRFLKTPGIVFEGKPLWFETVIALGFHFLGIYRGQDGALVLRYVGEKPTLLPFSAHIEELTVEGEPFDNDTAPLLTDPWR